MHPESTLCSLGLSESPLHSFSLGFGSCSRGSPSLWIGWLRSPEAGGALRGLVGCLCSSAWRDGVAGRWCWCWTQLLMRVGWPGLCCFLPRLPLGNAAAAAAAPSLCQAGFLAASPPVEGTCCLAGAGPGVPVLGFPPSACSGCITPGTSGSQGAPVAPARRTACPLRGEEVLWGGLGCGVGCLLQALCSFPAG